MPAIRRLARWVKAETRHELPWIFGASFLFNLTANLFNISYTPYLYSIGIGSAAIFLVNMGNNLAQAVSFPLSGSLSETKGVDRVVHWSTYIRSVGYLAVVGFALVPQIQSGALGANFLAYAVMGASIAFYSTASSLILFRALRGRDAGRLLGVNGALGGVAAVGGGALAAALAVVGSFALTFLVSGVLLLFSLPLWTAARLADERRRSAGPVRGASGTGGDRSAA
jgi:MFS family permease